MAAGTLDSWMRSGSSASAAKKRKAEEATTSLARHHRHEQPTVAKRAKSETTSEASSEADLKSQNQPNPKSVGSPSQLPAGNPGNSISTTISTTKPAVKSRFFEADPSSRSADNPKSTLTTINVKRTTTDSSTETLKITEESGDIFSAPANSLIIHACNCDGSWGGGIALAFKKNYPSAFPKYAKHCKDTGGELVGTALLIPPTGKDAHFIGCLFTSRHYGRRKDSPTKILAATGPSVEQLMQQVDDFHANAGAADRVSEVRICKINSGLFNVPWAKTKAILEGIDVRRHDVKAMKVVSPPE